MIAVDVKREPPLSAYSAGPKSSYRFLAPDREGGQIMMSAPSRVGRRAAKTLDHRAILTYRPMV